MSSSASLGPDSRVDVLEPDPVDAVGRCSESVSATAPPSPPMTVCSSTVITRPVRSAAATIASTSSGLSVGTWTTWASMPSVARSSAASTTRGVCDPVLNSVTSPPSRTTTARAEREAVVVVEQALGGVADEPDVAGTLVGGRPAERLVRLDVVGRRHHDHPGHRPHDRQVVDDDVAHPGLAREEPGVARGDLHVGARLGDEDPDLVQGTHDGERDERADERDQAHRGQAGGDAEHVLLGDPHLEIAVGMGLLEDVGARRAADVAVEHDDPRIVVGDRRDRLAEDLAHGPAHRQRHRAPPSTAGIGSPRSAMAWANSSGLIGRVCQ